MPSIFRFKANDKMFMNSWNLKQVIFIEGTLELTTRLETLIKIVQSTDMVPRISPTNLGNVRVLDVTEPKCKELHNKFMENNDSFNKTLNTLVVPLRFSILALLSSKKSTVFDEQLMRLMRYISGMKYDGNKIYKIQKNQQNAKEWQERPEDEEVKAAIESPSSSGEEQIEGSPPREEGIDGNLAMLSNEKYL